MPADIRDESDRIKQAVRDRYGAAARKATPGAASCCGSSGLLDQAEDTISKDLYVDDELEGIPESAVRASLGCGNPAALAELLPGEVVLDLGSGGGIDVLLSARRVAPTGKASGLAVTPDMLELARRHQRGGNRGAADPHRDPGDREPVALPAQSLAGIRRRLFLWRAGAHVKHRAGAGSCL